MRFSFGLRQLERLHEMALEKVATGLLTNLAEKALKTVSHRVESLAHGADLVV